MNKLKKILFFEPGVGEKHFDEAIKETKIWSKFINIKNPVIYDIGCNIGFITIGFLERYSSAKIYAFDPIEKNILRFKYNMIAYNIYHETNKMDYKIAFDTVGFYNKKGEFEFKIPKYDLPTHGGAVYSMIHVDGQNMVTGKVELLDEYYKTINDNFKNPDIIKIDVEGSEWELIERGQETIKKAKLVIIELTDNDGRGDSKKKCIEWFESNGYVNKDVTGWSPNYIYVKK